MTHPLSTLLAVLERFRASLAEQLGPDEATLSLELMAELVNRLPHNNVLAATRAEIQAAGTVMLREGFTPEEMRQLQLALASFLDLALAARLVTANVVRSKEAVPTASAVEVAAAALVVGFSRDLVGRL